MDTASTGAPRRKTVSILLPCYNEEANLEALYRRVSAVMDANPAYDWEAVMVNDGSKDGTLAGMRRIHGRDPRFRYVDLSRNFGKEIGMLAGMDYSRGDCLVIMDSDLQHPPELIPDMLKLWEEGNDDVYAKRRDRGKESWLRKKLSLLYYSILQRTTRIPVLQNCGDFRLLDRMVVDALREMRETQRYTKGLYCQAGFRKKEIEFDQGSREAGESSMSFRRLFSLAMDGITSYTTAPLRIASVLGFVVSIVAFVYMVYVMVKAIAVGDPVAGFPSLMCVILFLGGVQLICIGIIGEYLARIFIESKHRPPYFVRESDGQTKRGRVAPPNSSAF